MALPDWAYYAAGAGAAGIAAGLLLHDTVVPPEPIYTGVGREYRNAAGDVVHAAVWAVPGNGYISRFERPVANGIAVEEFPDMEKESFEWPFTAALWADDLMDRLDYKPVGVWANAVNETAAIREKERPKRAKVAGRRR